MYKSGVLLELCSTPPLSLLPRAAAASSQKRLLLLHLFVVSFFFADGVK
jgi:hypothetical protein